MIALRVTYASGKKMTFVVPSAMTAMGFAEVACRVGDRMRAICVVARRP